MDRTPKKVAVIGAGPMGLAAAYQLALDGHAPTLFEAADQVGGMAICFEFGGNRIERFYHFHCTSDHDLEALLKELGLHDRLKWTETKMGYFFEGRVQPWGNPIALLRFRGLSLVAKFRAALHAFMCLKRSDWTALDRQEATTWLRKWVGAEAYEKLWRRLFEYKFYDQAEDLSAAWIWARIKRVGTSRYSLMREKLGYLDGGSQAYLDAIEAAILKGGGTLRLSTPVREVVIKDGAIAGIKTDQGYAPFDAVISTVPLPYVPAMIPDLPAEIMAKFNSQKNVAVVCVIAKLARQLTPNFWLNVNDPDMDIPGLVEYSNLRQMNGHIVYAPFYMPGDHPKYSEPNDVFTDKVVTFFKRINPELADEDILEIQASRYRFAQPVCGPGFLDTLPPTRLSVSGLWVADTSYYYPEDRGISESTKFGRALARDVSQDG